METKSDPLCLVPAAMTSQAWWYMCWLALPSCSLHLCPKVAEFWPLFVWGFLLLAIRGVHSRASCVSSGNMLSVCNAQVLRTSFCPAGMWPRNPLVLPPLHPHLLESFSAGRGGAAASGADAPRAVTRRQLQAAEASSSSTAASQQNCPHKPEPQYPPRIPAVQWLACPQNASLPFP